MRRAVHSISCHMSAVSGRILLADADDKQHNVSAMSAEAIGLRSKLKHALSTCH